MIIFFFGADTFRLKAKTREILDYYKRKKNGLNLISFDCLEKNFKQLKETCSQNSLFKEKKLILIENLFKNNDFKDLFFKEVAFFLSSQDNILLLSEDQDLSEKDSLVSFLIKSAKYQRFNFLTPLQIKKWIKKHNLQIEEEALSLLIESTKNDLWKLNNEIKKLTNLFQGKKITKKDVLLLTEIKLESDIFKTIEAISRRDKAQAVKLVYSHLDKGDPPLYLLSMISYQFRNLIILKELIDQRVPPEKISQQSKLHPFVVKKSLSLLSNFSFEELKKIYHKIFQIDTKIKIGKIEPETGLMLLIAEI